jgi:tRNA(fMet)-specific endonuclease VapC
MYLLDTNICIFLKNKKPKHVLERLHQVINQNIFVSSVTVAELYFGVFNSQNIEKNYISLVEFLAPFKILNFDDEDAKEFGKIRSKLKKEGKTIGPYDLQIAAQAIAKDLILVINNTNEFIRVDRIRIEDWK